jgi:phosphoglycerate dehydrogenase-like enzyme
VQQAEAALGGIPAGIDVDCFMSDDNIPDSVGECEMLVARYMYPPRRTMAAVARMEKLKYVQLLSAGYENFLEYLPPGVKLLNAAGVHDASTAELAVSLALVSNRYLDRYARAMPSGTWQMDFGISLADRRCLIVGYGRIGKAIEARLRGFEVASVTRIATHARVEDGLEVHGIDELAALLPDADIVFLICPLTAQTEGLFDAAALAKMAPGALLVNVSRGKVVNTDDLLAALHSGHIRAALDVTDPEPLPADHPLWQAPGVFISPHCGGQSDAFYPRSNKLIREQLQRLAQGEPLINEVAVG